MQILEYSSLDTSRVKASYAKVCEANRPSHRGTIEAKRLEIERAKQEIEKRKKK